MPTPRVVLNGFTAKEVHEITGLSIPMINYLRRYDFLIPAYDSDAPARGKVRYYSYRDLVAAKIVQSLRFAGVGLKTIKTALELLRTDEELWVDVASNTPEALQWIYTDGKSVFIERGDGVIEYLRSDRQFAFSFLVDVGRIVQEVFEAIPVGVKRQNFSLQNKDLVPESKQRNARP